MPRTLFVGRGNGGVAWYRCALPAMHLGQDWIGIVGAPPHTVNALAGYTTDVVRFEHFGSYEVVVLQYQASREWAKAITSLREGGTRVLFEVDDWARSVRKKSDHGYAKNFDKDFLEQFELCMSLCDGVICSTEWLASRYRSVNRRVFVCRNAIDLPRYSFSRPERAHTTIGWAGGTGHAMAMEPWLAAVESVLQERPATRFVSVGQPFADRLADRFGADRCQSVPPSPMETYPAAMSTFDVALAPAGRSSFYQGKSDLRWLESSALGIPLVAEPEVYPEIEDGVTGFHAATPEQAREVLLRLVDDPAERRRVGAQAHAHVAEHRNIATAAAQWAGVIREAAAGVRETLTC